MPRRLARCFDRVARGACLARTQPGGLLAGHGRGIRLEPVPFAPMLQAQGRPGPADIEPWLAVPSAVWRRRQ